MVNVQNGTFLKVPRFNVFETNNFVIIIIARLQDTQFLSLRDPVQCKIYIGFGLTLKAPITTAADDIYKYIFIVFQRK